MAGEIDPETGQEAGVAVMDRTGRWGPEVRDDDPLLRRELDLLASAHERFGDVRTVSRSESDSGEPERREHPFAEKVADATAETRLGGPGPEEVVEVAVGRKIGTQELAAEEEIENLLARAAALVEGSPGGETRAVSEEIREGEPGEPRVGLRPDLADGELERQLPTLVEDESEGGHERLGEGTKVEAAPHLGRPVRAAGEAGRAGPLDPLRRAGEGDRGGERAAPDGLFQEVLEGEATIHL